MLWKTELLACVGYMRCQQASPKPLIIPQVVGLFGDSKHPGMAYHSRPEEDPYITVHEDSDSDKDDFVLKGTDRLILTARNEDDVSHLEVGGLCTFWHRVQLLCAQTVDFSPGSPCYEGNGHLQCRDGLTSTILEWTQPEHSHERN